MTQYIAQELLGKHVTGSFVVKGLKGKVIGFECDVDSRGLDPDYDADYHKDTTICLVEIYSGHVTPYWIRHRQERRNVDGINSSLLTEISLSRKNHILGKLQSLWLRVNFLPDFKEWCINHRLKHYHGKWSYLPKILLGR